MSLNLTGGLHNAGRYWLFAVPAIVVILAVIAFPWLFTLYASLHLMEPTLPTRFVGLNNFISLFRDPNFGWSLVRTIYFAFLSVVASLVLGVFAALVFHRQFVLRGWARTIFIMPMMATPVATSLIWTMMFHPQVGVLNYILTSVGLPPAQWVSNAATVIPTLALVETWHWTPLVMLIILGGLASLPTEPFEAAKIDGANAVQTFFYVTLPLLWPFVLVCALLRTIEAFKAFDTIYVITRGGPGDASETLNMFLYQNAFSYFHTGYASAVAIVFFLVVLVFVVLQLALKRSAT